MTPKNSVETEKKVDAVKNTIKDANQDAAEGRVVADSLAPLGKVETETTVTNAQKEVAAVKESVKSEATAVEGAKIATDEVDDKTVEAFDKKVEEDNTTAAAKTSDNGTEQSDSEEKKSFSEKAWDFLKEYKKPLLWGAGITGAVLLYRRYAKRKARKEAEAQAANGWKTPTTENEKKWFWDTGRGKALKYTAIGSGIYYWVHGLTTGKWWLDKLFDWDKEKDLQDDTDKVEAYEEAVQNNPEIKETFEWLGDATDKLYGTMFAKELADGWQDDADMETIAQKAKGGKEALKWVVPRCISQENASIDAILADKEQSMSFLNASVAEIKQKVSWVFAGTGSYLLSYLTSGFDMTAGKEAFLAKFDASQAEWEEAAWQVKFYYREKVRLQTFLLQKEKSLIEKIATEKATGSDKGDIADLIKDGAWLKENVYSDPRYATYRTGSLENAYKTLKTAWLMDGSIDADTQEIVEEMDADRDDTLDYDGKKTVLQRSSEDIVDGKLDATNKDTLLHVATKINKELQWDFIEEAKESAWNVYSELFDWDEKAKRTFMQQTGIDKIGSSISEWLAVYTNKISDGSITAAEIKDFNFLINSFYAFKKEVYAWANTVQYIHNPDGSWTVKAGDFFGGQLLNLGTACKKVLWWDFKEAGIYVLSALPLIAVSAYGIALINPATAWKTWLATGKIGVAAVSKVAGFATAAPARMMTAGSWTARQFGGKVYGATWAVRKRYYGGLDWAEKVFDDFANKKISLDKAAKVFDSGSNAGVTQLFNKKLRDAWKAHANTSLEFQQYLIEETFNKSGTNKVITDNLDTIVKYYDAPVFEKLMTAKNPKYTDVIALMKKVDAMSLEGNKKTLFEALLSHRSMSANALEKTILHIDKIDDAVLANMDIAKLADGLAHNPASLDSVVHINEYAKALQAWEKAKQAWKTAAEAAKKAETLRKDAKALWLTDATQKTLHTHFVDKVQQLQAYKSTLANPAAIQVAEKDIIALKQCAEKLALIDPTEARVILDATNDIKITYLARIMEETSDIKWLLTSMKNARTSSVSALIDPLTKKPIVKYGDIALDKLEDILKKQAPEFLDDLKKTNRIADFAKDMWVIVDDVAKISKFEKAAILLEKIVTKIR